MNVREAVEQILQSPQLRQSLETTVRNLTLPLPPSQSTSIENRASLTSTPSTSIRTELHNLFPTIGQRSRNRSRNNVRGHILGNSGPKNTKFFKDVILLTSKRCVSTLKGHEKAKAYETGFALSGVEFSTNMDFLNIKECISCQFADKLSNTSFELVVPISGVLTKLSLPDGKELDGAMLRRIYHQKVVYLRPNEDIGNTALEVGEEYNHSEVHEIDDACIDDFNDLGNDCTNMEDFGPAKNNEYHDELNLLTQILQNLSTRITAEKVCYFNVYREDVFQCCVRAMRRSSFDPFAKIDVKFSDIEGQTEGAIDMGGPTRELFRLTLTYLRNSSLFLGSDKKYVSFDSSALQRRYYFEAGRIIALGIVHAGLGPHFFSSSLFTALTRGIEFAIPSMDFIDNDIVEKINQLSDIITQDEFTDHLLKENIFSIAGINLNTTLDKKYEVVDATIKFYHLFRTKPAFEQFVEGLKTCDVLELMESHPTLFEPIMCNDKLGLTMETMDKIFAIQFSEVGTNVRIKENRTVAFWRDFLLDCEEENTLEELLIFATGSDTIPCLGFDKKVDIKFHYDDCKIYPTANTCGLELYLPTCHARFEAFRDSMNFGIDNSKTFGMP